MKLDEFVRQSLVDISNGVEKAQRESMHYIAPGKVNGDVVVDKKDIHFEIIVTVNKEAGGGISVLSFGDAKLKGSSENINKLSFDIPIYFNAPTERNPLHHSRLNEIKSGEEK